MPTEDEARRLLAKAAATIGVDDSPPMTLTGLPEPRHRRWPVLAAAAAVVLAMGGGYLVAQQFGDDPQPTPAPANDRSEVPDDDQGGLSAEREASAEAFVAWARGDGPAPEFADRVRLLNEGGPPFGAATWMDDPTNRWLYSMCSGLSPGVCGIDPIYVIEHYDGVVVPALGRTYCRQGTGDLPSHLAGVAPTDLIRLTVPEPRTCDQDLPVELWIDDDGAIYAVNLTFAPKDQPPVGTYKDRDQIARAFVAWARGGPTPAFADRVRIMFHGQSDGWTESPERLNTYSPCSGFGYPECGIDPVAGLARYRGPVTVRAGRSSCADGGEVARQFADAALDIVRIERPDPGACGRAWAVELWIDDEGDIYGANQAGTPVR